MPSRETRAESGVAGRPLRQSPQRDTTCHLRGNHMKSGGKSDYGQLKRTAPSRRLRPPCYQRYSHTRLRAVSPGSNTLMCWCASSGIAGSLATPSKRPGEAFFVPYRPPTDHKRVVHPSDFLREKREMVVFAMFLSSAKIYWNTFLHPALKPCGGALQLSRLKDTRAQDIEHERSSDLKK